MTSVDCGLKQADEGQVISHEKLVAKFTRNASLQVYLGLDISQTRHS